MTVRSQALRLGLDLDGVFADFNTEAALTTARLTGRTLIPAQRPYFPPVWDWWRAAGYRKTEIDQFWAHITTQPTWWADLPAYPGTANLFHGLQKRIEAHTLDVFFLTTRPGYNAHWQCVQWVREHGILHPQVAIAANAESRGLLAAGLRLNAYVDDYAPNLAAVQAHAPAVVRGFYERPWGAEHTDAVRASGAHVFRDMAGLEAFIDYVMGL